MNNGNGYDLSQLVPKLDFISFNVRWDRQNDWTVGKEFVYRDQGKNYLMAVTEVKLDVLGHAVSIKAECKGEIPKEEQ
jgi:hypothetical protein